VFAVLFLEATEKFSQFQGSTEAELVAWLRRILASKLVDLVRRYRGARRRDVALERDLAITPASPGRRH
jgi:RNA polymerase sigma-70 factor (ECF subfamily)